SASNSANCSSARFLLCTFPAMPTRSGAMISAMFIVGPSRCESSMRLDKADADLIGIRAVLLCLAMALVHGLVSVTASLAVEFFDHHIDGGVHIRFRGLGM